jgi:hypothetical protein
MIRRRLLVAIFALQAVRVWACPFCTTLRPTLAKQVDAADVALLGDVIDANGPALKLRVQRVLKGTKKKDANQIVEITRAVTDDVGSGSLLLAMGVSKRQPSTRLSWTALALNEASFAYVARSPGGSAPVAERLRYVLPFLEHSDALIADDAYLEFGHAPFDEIAKFAGQLPVDRLREWIADESTPPERKGLYGLLLGLAASDQKHDEIAEDFWRWITAPASDFRSGFDGVLGGYLWLGKKTALARLEERYLDDANARAGDLQHLLRALRVYHDYGHDIPGEELLRAYRGFLDHPSVAALAIADLARWQDWRSLDRVASLFGRAGYDDSATERAVVGYLLACPMPEAARQIARLRKLVPDRVAEAERLEETKSSDK